MSAEGYDKNRSSVSPDKLAEFLRADIVEDLQSVPSIGPKAVENLAALGVTTTFQLIGQFLMLKDAGVGPVEHCDRFWYWLKDAKISSNRSGIVQCIAEKLDTMFPGIYDGSAYN
jgi:hypothetical protein